jgi:uncharacterized membrane protein HdeD (DUF308 family)
MLKSYNRMSFALGIPGIILQVCGLYAVAGLRNERAWIFILFGIGLFIWGLAYYARAKSRSPWWCLLGLLSLLGMIILAFIPDDSFEEEETLQQ